MTLFPSTTTKPYGLSIWYALLNYRGATTAVFEVGAVVRSLPVITYRCWVSFPGFRSVFLTYVFVAYVRFLLLQRDVDARVYMEITYSSWLIIFAAILSTQQIYCSYLFILSSITKIFRHITVEFFVNLLYVFCIELKLY